MLSHVTYVYLCQFCILLYSIRSHIFLWSQTRSGNLMTRQIYFHGSPKNALKHSRTISENRIRTTRISSPPKLPREIWNLMLIISVLPSTTRTLNTANRHVVFYSKHLQLSISSVVLYMWYRYLHSNPHGIHTCQCQHSGSASASTTSGFR